MRLEMRLEIAGAVVLFVGCGPQNPPPGVDGGEATLMSCPATFIATNGHSCGDEGMTCSIPIDCMPTAQQARCECTGGTFRCVDAIGALGPEDEPRCQAGAASDIQQCPPSFRAAQGVDCTEVGFTCVYEGAACPGRPLPVQDYCQCKVVDASAGTMALACMKGLCALPPQ
jgi:hypothetical protein